MIKIAACLGFIILGIVINTGGVGDRGYLGAKFWHEPGAFRNGFNGFAGVFVIAAFSFGGTELVGLAAAESENPRKAIPTASKQVFWRIAFFYIVNLFIVGLILPSDDDRLLNSSGANTKASPFVLAIQDAGIQVLPSIMNAVITVAVISVANSCTFGSTRTMQALAEQGMAPKFLAYIDKQGRPLWCVIVQLAFGLLAYVGLASEGSTVFNWLLAISGLSYFFVWGSICLTHIRFRYVWKAQGYTLDQIPYKPGLGVIGSWIGFALNILCLIATFYSSLYVSLVMFLSPLKGPLANWLDSRIPSRPLTPRCSSCPTLPPPSSSPSTLAGRFIPETGGCGSLRTRSTSPPTCGCTFPETTTRSRLRGHGGTCPCGSSVGCFRHGVSQGGYRRLAESLG
jgi:amino acid transporter